MTTPTKLFLTLAASAMFLTSQAFAADPVLSPRAQGSQIKRVATVAHDADLARADRSPGVAAEAKATAQRTTPAGTGRDADLVRCLLPRGKQAKVMAAKDCNMGSCPHHRK